MLDEYQIYKTENKWQSKADIEKEINDQYKKKDWVELYNATASPVDLAGMYLSDNPLKPQKYQIQATEGINTVVPPYGHLIIWCDGSQPVNQLHAPFKLDNADSRQLEDTLENTTIGIPSVGLPTVLCHIIQPILPGTILCLQEYGCSIGISC